MHPYHIFGVPALPRLFSTYYLIFSRLRPASLAQFDLASLQWLVMNVMIRHAALFLALLAPAHGGECDWIEPGSNATDDGDDSWNTNQAHSSPSSPSVHSDCQIGGMTTCCAHSDCQADQYCFDTGYFSTGVWNAVGSCSHNPPDCCASGDADPIDRDPAQCPAVSACS